MSGKSNFSMFCVCIQQKWPDPTSKMHMGELMLWGLMNNTNNVNISAQKEDEPCFKIKS